MKYVSYIVFGQHDPNILKIALGYFKIILGKITRNYGTIKKQPLDSGRKYNAEPSVDSRSVLESREGPNCSFSIHEERAKKTQHDGLV